MKAAVITVGSELLSGQIENRHSSWIPRQLEPLGISVVTHLTVDDVEADIVRALAAAAGQAGLVFLTGGLGPTSDDLTRDAVAAWLGASLVFDEPSWTHIGEFFGRLRREPPPANRQQCWFPAGARVLSNREGTANAFHAAGHGVELWVMPGPPRELAAVWQDHVQPDLEGRVAPEARLQLRSWRTIGCGESHLAELVDPVLRAAGIWHAYRAHAPYVELKIRYPAGESARWRELCDQLTAITRPWLWERDQEDVFERLARAIGRHESVEIYDGATRGLLLESLGPALRALGDDAPSLSFVSAFDEDIDPPTMVEECLGIATDSDLSLAVAGYDDEGGWAFGLRTGERQLSERRPALWPGAAGKGRQVRATVALVARAWLDLLERQVN